MLHLTPALETKLALLTSPVPGPAQQLVSNYYWRPMPDYLQCLFYRRGKSSNSHLEHSLCRSGYMNIRTIGHIRQMLPQHVQRLQNTAARKVTGTKKFEHIGLTPVLHQLHWLPVRQRMVFLKDTAADLSRAARISACLLAGAAGAA